RREARGHRKLIARRARRMRLLWSLLQSSRLLPEGKPADVLPKLDKELSEAWVKRRGLGIREKEQERNQFFHVLPYFLRARALDEKLSELEIGRALYHLAQRRGFQSNRKAPPKKDEDEGKVKAGISDLQKEINESGTRTLGEYFSKLNPEEERIRTHYTSRKMYKEEFEAIWNAQTPHYPTILTEDLKRKVSNAIFYQRPLKIRKGFIGTCEHEPDRRRAPRAILAAQRFRLLQKVTDLEFIYASTKERRKLSPEERTALIEALETQGDLTFGKARTLLKLPKGRFNFEAFGEKKAKDSKLTGNRTASKLIEIFGEERWKGFSPEQQEQIVEDVRSFEKEQALMKRGMTKWGLDKEKAEEFSHLKLENGYCNLSRQALAKLLPLMEKGTPYKTAVKEVYGNPEDQEPLDSLPPVFLQLPNLRNPAVARTLTEVR
ncbi:MAG: hypothetical protein QMD05_11105, partial [Candidatus Brocadiaceae bacterium]|nr:hypothetical protein [Candidatus Brocadiaceae bacterium]